jgi:hypothetical protein
MQDVGSLLSGTKWQLVELIAQSPKSPGDLAVQLKTSIANVSIQLKTLELASIISRTRVLRPQAGSPRVLYSLKRDFLYVTTASSTVQVKKPLTMSEQKSFTLAVWQLPEQLQHPVLTLYYTQPQFFLPTSTIALNPANSTEMSISLLITGAKSAPKPTTLDINGKKVVFSFTLTQSIPQQAIMLQVGEVAK